MAEVDMDVFKALGSDNAALTEHVCVVSPLVIKLHMYRVDVL